MESIERQFERPSELLPGDAAALTKSDSQLEAGLRAFPPGTIAATVLTFSVPKGARPQWPEPLS